MENSTRWIFFIAGIGVLVLCIYYFINPSWLFWPLYPFGGWRYHYFGPRIWPVFPFFGMLILIVAGILMAKYFFQALRDSSISKKDDLTFCPYRGKDLSQGEIISEVQAEKV